VNIPERESLFLHLAARCPLNYVVTWEEEVVIKYLRKNTTRLFNQTMLWSITDGLRSPDEKVTQAKLPGPYETLEAICKNTEKVLYILLDFHPYVNDSRILRKLRDAYYKLQSSGSCIVITASKLDIPLDLEKEISVFHFPLPSISAISQIYSQIEKGVSKNKNLTIDLTQDDKSALIEAGLGLTEKELKNVFAKALVRDRKLDIGDIDVILDEKRQIIEKSGYLEYYPAEASFTIIWWPGKFESLAQASLFCNWEKGSRFGASLAQRGSNYGRPGYGKKSGSESHRIRMAMATTQA
jgi:hypothetical protein